MFVVPFHVEPKESIGTVSSCAYNPSTPVRGKKKGNDPGIPINPCMLNLFHYQSNLE